MHYYRSRRHGDPSALIRDPYNNLEDGKGRWVDPKGYVRIRLKRNTKSMYEHRYLMSQYLGRELTKEETVHHKNGNREDNRLVNLELWSTKQPYGQRVVDKIIYAREILETYKDLEGLL